MQDYEWCSNLSSVDFWYNMEVCWEWVYYDLKHPNMKVQDIDY